MQFQRGTVTTYQNKRNSNKYVEVKKGNDGHHYIRQYMKWDGPNGTFIKNYLASKSVRGRFYRSTLATIRGILSDYNPIVAG